MKRLFVTVFVFIILLFNSLTVHAKISADSLGYKVLAVPSSQSKLKEVTHYTVIDGDTLKIELSDNTVVQANLLLIDAPEIKESKPFAQEAKERLVTLLKNSNRIEIEYDSGAHQDETGFDLVYLWVDGILVQEILVTEGFARLNYVYSPNTRYLTEIFESQSYAQLNNFRIWSRSDTFATDVVGETVNHSNNYNNQSQTSHGFVESRSQTAAPATSVYYGSCADVRAAGAAPIYPGDPGWSPKFDRDKDGVGCE